MTISGLVSHLRWMEHYLFQVTLGGEKDRGPLDEVVPGFVELEVAVPA
jgi:hypothetical protein